MTGKLTMSPDGRVHGPAEIEYNDRFPCVNGTPGGMSVPHETLGVLMHTMVSDLPSAVQAFNTVGFEASAHFGISESGLIHQFGPVNGWRAWHAKSANGQYYGIEHADAGDPDRPLTQQQITASAQLVELLSRIGNFPLQVTNTPGGEGYGTHNMGGASYGGHTCPDLPPAHVRSAQRPQIIALAMAIRSGAPAEDWTETMIANLPTLIQGSADKAGAVQMVHRMQALVKVIGDINKVPAASAVAATGTYDKTTWLGVLALQKMFGLTQDGAVGAATWGALIAGQHG